MTEFNDYIESNSQRFIEELKEFCRQPSIAAQGIGLVEMADLVRSRFERLGAEVRLLPIKDGPSAIYAEIGSGKNTLLIYNHYDVQPPDPIDLWESEPFDPQVRDGRLYARGVADNKGDLLTRIQAVETYLATNRELPIKIKWFIEGEEEVGSPHLEYFTNENSSLLSADGCLWESGGKDENERLTISLGCKGILYVEMKAHGANSDLHSSIGTIVPNPVWRLIWALSTLKDIDDNILIDGIMDHVSAPTTAEMQMLSAIPFNEEKIKTRFGIPRFIRNLTGVDLLKKHLFEPTCTICGLNAGYTGEGTKTVLPRTATAKIDFRLVPELKPSMIASLLRKHLDKNGFEDIEIIPYHGEAPAKTSPDTAIVKAAIAAATKVYNQNPVVYPLMAGSGPMYILTQKLGTAALSAGICNAGSGLHAPNENIRLNDYFDGIRFVGELINQFGM